MQDNELLDVVIKYHQSIADLEFCSIVDLNYIVRTVDKLYPQLYNLTPADYIGKHLLNDLVRQSPERKHITSSNIEQCINNKEIISVITLNFERERDYQLLLMSFIPLINEQTKNVFAIKITANVPRYPLYFYKLKEIFKFEANQVNKSKSTFLSQREHEILFLLFQSYSYLQISELLSLVYNKEVTYFSVTKAINRGLLKKFDVNNVDGLKDVASKHGYHRLIPETLAVEFIISVDKL